MATNTKGLAQEIQIQILKKIQIRYERIYKEGMAFACYRIFSLFELSLSCVSFNAQDIDLTEQIYEIETPRWSDALGWGGGCVSHGPISPPSPGSYWPNDVSPSLPLNLPSIGSLLGFKCYCLAHFVDNACFLLLLANDDDEDVFHV